ncbi:hypothetical protein [Ulvibacterium sp.]|uniref:hypothetical protein n=1 Tax=Ulvibacterium sp. TaxID=2665914 RepID=UPI0026163349|nr:hypothetical protein [Ulvibacterium sp.]
MAQVIKYIKNRVKEYLVQLTILGSFLGLCLTISNISINLFEPPLLPFYAKSFEAFHSFCRIILEKIVFSWAVPLLESIIYAISWLGSLVLPIEPIWPKIKVAGLYVDFALISVALTKAFSSVDLLIPHPKREAAMKSLSDKQRNEMWRSEGWFWGTIHRFLEFLNRTNWKILRVILFPTKPFSKIRRFLEPTAKTIVGSVMMWGFVRFFGYLINVSLAGQLKFEIMDIRKRVMRYVLLNIVAAIIATVIFLAFNGWLVKASVQ